MCVKCDHDPFLAYSQSSVKCFSKISQIHYQLLNSSQKGFITTNLLVIL